MRRRWQVVARAVSWPIVPALLSGTVLVVTSDAERPAAAVSVPAAVTFLAAVLGPYLVGVLLTAMVPQEGAGWAFLGLSTSLAWSAFSEEYAVTALRADSALPGGALMATFSDSSFIGWFVFLGLALHYTVAPQHPRELLRRLPLAMLVLAVLFQGCVLVRATELSPPFSGLVSPLMVPVVAGPAALAGAGLVVALGVCVMLCVYELFAAFRRGTGEERRRLLWLVVGAVPLGPGVVISFALSYAGHDWAAAPVLAVCVVTLALGAGMSILRFRLYDVERVVTDSVAYALSTGAVVSTFGLVMLVFARTVPPFSSPVSTILATLAAVGVARPAYAWARDSVDRRFNRRRFDAVRMIETRLAAGTDDDVELLVRDALGDPSAQLMFGTQDGWVTADGRQAEPPQHSVDIETDPGLPARLSYDRDRNEPGTVAAVARSAAVQIINLGLRAELGRQVERVRESRTRLATAHFEERRRIERDLHDGAQQRLLAIALQLQSARVNGTAGVLHEGIDRAVAELAATVQELRSLASGLQPAALAGGGLCAATAELSHRIPMRLDVHVTDARFPETIESAAWFVIAEGVANAVKHAQAQTVSITVVSASGALRVLVTDDGVGGADPRGSGLQGLADRVSALGGHLVVGRGAAGGTRIEAVFPCVS